MTIGLIVLLSAVALIALFSGFLFSLLVISKRSSEAASEAFNKAFDIYTSKEKQ